MSKLWGGRFEAGTHADVEAFTTSLDLDKRLWDADLRGSLAHVHVLEKAGVLSAEEAKNLSRGLLSLHEEITQGKVEFGSTSAEDIHSEIERLLTQRLGEVAGKLHTARSRNDQVATATRLYLREQLEGLETEVKSLQAWLVGAASLHLETILPGTTHFQPAQPVSLAHHLLAYFWMLQRDRERLADCRGRANTLPLGSAALAGTSFPLDRELAREELGFDSLCENSLDAVSDRDFVVEFLGAAALVMAHLSRLSEELIVWSSPAFGFVELSDATTTGSSIMPQKKNPDVAELIRGKVGRLAGGWTGALMMIKGLPLSYNRDLQEDKHHLFEGLDTVRSSVRLMKLILEGATFHPERMAAAVRGDFSNATDLADYLVKKGLPFRQAHEVVGKIVRACLEKKKTLETLSTAELKAFCSLIDDSVGQILNPVSVMRSRTSRGGTAPDAVRFQIGKAKEILECR